MMTSEQKLAQSIVFVGKSLTYWPFINQLQCISTVQLSIANFSYSTVYKKIDTAMGLILVTCYLSKPGMYTKRAVRWVSSKILHTGLLADTGCVQTAGKSESNQIPSKLRFLGLIVHNVFSKCLKRMWLGSGQHV